MVIARIVTVVLLLVRPPLLARWVGGRRFRNRSRPGADRDLYRVQGHGLRPAG